jgi:DNA excision repair protein ERCC-3
MYPSPLLLCCVSSPQRQRFLVDQGYSFKVVTELTDMANVTDLKFGEKRQQLELLAKVLATEDTSAGQEDLGDADPTTGPAKNRKLEATRRRGNAQALSGSNDRA